MLLYHRPAVPWFEDAATVTDHIESFARYSRFPVWEVANTDLGFPPGLAEVPVGAVVLHYSLFHSSGYKLDEGFRRFLAETDVYKVVFFQDEHHFCRQRFAFLNEYRFDCVFTCLEPSELGKVYERYTSVPKLVSYLPGYVSETMVDAAARFALPDERRSIDIGYRGRSLAPYMGRGALEKGEIATRFAELFDPLAPTWPSTSPHTRANALRLRPAGRPSALMQRDAGRRGGGLGLRPRGRGLPGVRATPERSGPCHDRGIGAGTAGPARGQRLLPHGQPASFRGRRVRRLPDPLRGAISWR